MLVSCFVDYMSSITDAHQSASVGIDLNQSIAGIYSWNTIDRSVRVTVLVFTEVQIIQLHITTPPQSGCKLENDYVREVLQWLMDDYMYFLVQHSYEFAYTAVVT